MDEPFAEHVGVELGDVTEEEATARLVLEAHHVNGHGTPHGGALYTLADTAFAVAANAGDDDAVALETSTSYLDAAEVGDTVTATARRKHDSRKTGLYEVALTTDDGTLVAEFRGRVYKL